MGINPNLGPKTSHILLGIIEKRLVPTGVDFHFFSEHHISSLWSKTGLKSRKAVQNHLFTLHTGRAVSAACLSSLRTQCTLHLQILENGSAATLHVLPLILGCSGTVDLSLITFAYTKVFLRLFRRFAC
jgi:hypothetical protein